MEFLGWPPSCRPEVCAVVEHNEREVERAAPVIWSHLVHAQRWPRWYANARRVRFEGDARTLGPGVTFHWRTFGADIVSTVDLFDPPCALGWWWYGRSAAGYHVWLLEPAGDGSGRTRVVTEETQRGPGPRLLSPALGPALWLSHELWLTRLAQQAAAGPAPVPVRPPRR